MATILLTGMSGTGKSSALAELATRGYRVVDTDEPGWRQYVANREPDELHQGEWLRVEPKISARTTNYYGKFEVERAMVLDDRANVEPLLRRGCTHELEATRPLADIVEALIALADSLPPTRS